MAAEPIEPAKPVGGLAAAQATAPAGAGVAGNAVAGARPAAARSAREAFTASFPYQGPPELEAPLRAALAQVVDPEIAMNIVDVGLVYGVRVADERVHVQVTMTSTACPVAEVLVEDIETELDRVVPAGMTICVELVWEPPWSPDRMSAEGRRFMQG